MGWERLLEAGLKKRPSNKGPTYSQRPSNIHQHTPNDPPTYTNILPTTGSMHVVYQILASFAGAPPTGFLLASERQSAPDPRLCGMRASEASLCFLTRLTASWFSHFTFSRQLYSTYILLTFYLHSISILSLYYLTTTTLIRKRRFGRPIHHLSSSTLSYLSYISYP